MIRCGTLEDIDSIVNMAREFWAHTIYDDEFCADSVAEMARLCIEQNMMSVIDSGGIVGFACGINGGLLGNQNVSSGTEVAWWVDPNRRNGRNGIRLLKHIEGLAKKAGVKYWNMVYMLSSMPEEIQRIYEKLGYKKTEVIYTRVL